MNGLLSPFLLNFIGMSKTVSADFFQNLIQLVAHNFTIDSEENYNSLCYGVNFFTKFIFLQDGLIDEDIDWVQQFDSKENILYDINSSYRKSFHHLNKVFNQDHPFWNYLFQEEKKYYNYIIKEKYLNTQKSTILLTDFEEMTFAKHALALVPVQGLDWLFKSQIPYENIKKLFVPIFNGMQMMDDIDDFYKDYISGNWNFIQYQVQKIIKDEQLVDDGSLTRFSERVFYASGFCKEQSIYVLKEYQKAKKLANEYQFSKIETWLDLIIEEVHESIAFVDRVSD